jgi:hypothetical protein
LITLPLRASIVLPTLNTALEFEELLEKISARGMISTARSSR